MMRIIIVLLLVVCLQIVHGGSDTSTSSTTIKDPCIEAEEHSDERRISDIHFSELKCDKDIIRAGWHKFTADGAPTTLPTVCLMPNACGSTVALRIELEGQALPQAGDEIEAWTCGAYDVLGKYDCCVLRNPARIRNCTDFLVYHLLPPDRCSVSYCVNDVDNTFPHGAIVKMGEDVKGDDKTTILVTETTTQTHDNTTILVPESTTRTQTIFPGVRCPEGANWCERGEVHQCMSEEACNALPISTENATSESSPTTDAVTVESISTNGNDITSESPVESMSTDGSDFTSISTVESISTDGIDITSNTSDNGTVEAISTTSRLTTVESMSTDGNDITSLSSENGTVEAISTTSSLTTVESMSTDGIDITSISSVPSKVGYLDAVYRGSSHFLLEWGKPKKPNGYVTGYKVGYRFIQGIDLGDLEVLEEVVGKRRVFLGGLSPDTLYRVYVWGVSREGLQGNESYIDVRTADPNAELARPIVEEVLAGLTSVNVTWRLPEIKGIRVGSNYSLQYREVGERVWKSVQEQGLENLWQENEIFWQDIEGLEEATQYDVRVMATEGMVGTAEFRNKTSYVRNFTTASQEMEIYSSSVPPPTITTTVSRNLFPLTTSAETGVTVTPESTETTSEKLLPTTIVWITSRQTTKSTVTTSTSPTTTTTTAALDGRIVIEFRNTKSDIDYKANTKSSIANLLNADYKRAKKLDHTFTSNDVHVTEIETSSDRTAVVIEVTYQESGETVKSHPDELLQMLRILQQNDRLNTEEFEENMGTTIEDFYRYGERPPRTTIATGHRDTYNIFYDKLPLFIAIIVMSSVCLLICLFGLVYLRCYRNHRSWNTQKDAERAKLKDNRVHDGLDNPVPVSEMMSDEQTETSPPTVNGSHPPPSVTADDEKGWVIPIDQAPDARLQIALKTEDTKL